jgi:hypothetical protein
MLGVPNRFGSLQLTLNPPEAATAGAFWQVDGGIPQRGGATVVGLAAGNHSISFGTVAHWTTPVDLTVTILASQTICTSAIYVVDAELESYANTILALQPVAYWQLNETNQVPSADVITNSGSLGAIGDGIPFGDPVQGLTGIVNRCASFSNPSLDVNYLGSFVAIPFNLALNPSGPFTVEFWAKPNQSTTDYFCPASSIDNSQNAGASRFGWVFYEGPGNQWVFRVGNGDGYIAEVAGGITQTAVWQHVAGVYDGTNVTLYVNGVPVAGPAPAIGYMPNANPAVALCLGATSFGSRTFDGCVDEMAIYPMALILLCYNNACQFLQ